ncbi:helix-turn-helix domain-containing protein [Microbacterium sp. A1-JK]|uniref:helix-turn-helix domain-containing protein n=1 Tax=Microbacterium sp. A1-JK TaxID=3177516 RepID=UPI003889CF36
MKARADHYNAAIGRQIRAEISAAGQSILGVAKELGMARSTLDNYVNGKRDIPVPVAYQVAELLGLDPQVLIQRATERFHAEDIAARSNLIAGRFSVGTPRHTDLETADLHTANVAASRDNTPVDTERDNK